MNRPGYLNNSNVKDEIICRYVSLYYEDSVPFTRNLLTIGITNAIFTVASVCLNFLVLIAFIKGRSSLGISCKILFGLCVADLLTGLLVQPSFTVIFFRVHVAGDKEFPCELLIVSSIIAYILVGVSLLTISFVSLERYLAIFRPFLHQRLFTKRFTIVVCMIIWLFCSTVNLFCFLMGFQMIFFVLNAVIIAVSYAWNSLIYFRILRKVRQIAAEETSLQNRFDIKVADRHTESKANRTVGFVILSLLICYSAQVVVAMSKLIFGRNRIMNNYVEYWAYTLGLTNGTLNPVVYCYFNSEIRNEVLKLIGLAVKDKKFLTTNAHDSIKSIETR